MQPFDPDTIVKMTSRSHTRAVQMQQAAVS